MVVILPVARSLVPLVVMSGHVDFALAAIGYCIKINQVVQSGKVTGTLCHTDAQLTSTSPKSAHWKTFAIGVVGIELIHGSLFSFLSPP